MNDCVHLWIVGAPRGEWREGDRWHITDGVCDKCGAEREFATNQDELAKMGRNIITRNRSETHRQWNNAIMFSWND